MNDETSDLSTLKDATTTDKHGFTPTLLFYQKQENRSFDVMEGQLAFAERKLREANGRVRKRRKLNKR